MTKIDHLRKLLSGERGVPPAVSCWYHFAPEHHPPARALEAHLKHYEQFDLDFIKVMNEVGYPRAALGRAGVVQSLADLRKLSETPGDGPPFDAQLDLLRRLSGAVGGAVALTTTIFHAWMTLRNLTAPAKDVHRPPVIEARADPRDQLLNSFLREDAAALAAALSAIGRTLANFAQSCVEAGADGVYLATRDDWVDSPDNLAAWSAAGEQGGPYDSLVAPTDRAILAAASEGWFNVLHLCGRPLRFERFAGDAHIHVVHWADRVTGPSLREALPMLDAAGRGHVPACGVDNLSTLPNGSAEDVAGEVRDALAAANGRPTIITPGCTYDPRAVPAENIHAIVRAART